MSRPMVRPCCSVPSHGPCCTWAFATAALALFMTGSGPVVWSASSLSSLGVDATVGLPWSAISTTRRSQPCTRAQSSGTPHIHNSQPVNRAVHSMFLRENPPAKPIGSTRGPLLLAFALSLSSGLLFAGALVVWCWWRRRGPQWVMLMSAHVPTDSEDVQNMSSDHHNASGWFLHAAVLSHTGRTPFMLQLFRA